MRPRVLDLVGYIGRFVSDNWDAIADQSDITDELMNLGFSTAEITDAFQWIEKHTLGKPQKGAKRKAKSYSIRPLTHTEKAKLSPSAYGRLADFFARGVIDPLTLEEVLDKAMKAEVEEVSEKDIRRITALTLFNRHQPEWSELLHTTNTLVH